MAATPQPAVAITPPPAPARVPAPVTVASPPMTRCECAGMTFAEVARRMRAERLDAAEAVRRTGCGQNCGACVPDLVRFLAGV